MDDNELLNEIRKMNKLLALILTKDMKQNEKISLLAKGGFQPKDIALFIGSNTNVVSVTLNKLKKTGVIN